MDNQVIDDQGQFNQSFNHYNPPPRLPNAVATLVLGICSIVTCWCYGVIGLACGIIALFLSKEAVRMYKEEPEIYEQSWGTVRAGRICAIVGVSLSSAVLLFILLYFVLIGSLFFGALSQMPRN